MQSNVDYSENTCSQCCNQVLSVQVQSLCRSYPKSFASLPTSDSNATCFAIIYNSFKDALQCCQANNILSTTIGKNFNDKLGTTLRCQVSVSLSTLYHRLGKIVIAQGSRKGMRISSAVHCLEVHFRIQVQNSEEQGHPE